MSEEIKGYFLAEKVFWSKSNIHYALFFTSKRSVAAKVGGQLKDFLGPVAMEEYARKAEALKEVSIESILKADKDNFEIPYTDITHIEVKKAGWKDKLITEMRTIGTMTIKGKEEHKFQITRAFIVDPSSPTGLKPQKLEDCIKVIRSVLSDKLSAEV
ncbi:MAG: hypothetical protein ACQXXG_09990 [Candidatus Bathyarchaeia archaeon]